MALFLEILTGDLKGTRTPVREGLTIGRANCLLTIRDSKLSSKHARVEIRPAGDVWLMDMDSANGIKAEGKRVRELQLLSGTQFVLGRTKLLVLSTDDVKARPGAPLELKPEITADTVTRHALNPLVTLLERALRQARADTAARPLQAIYPALRLKFIRGRQTGEEWHIGYGPRMIGAHSVDLKLLEPGLPADCFQLLVQDGEVHLRDQTLGQTKILLPGGQLKKSADLQAGDRIVIGTTEIEVEYHDISE